MRAEGKQLRDYGIEPRQLVVQNVFKLYKDNQAVCDYVRHTLAGERFIAFLHRGGRTFENRYAPLLDDKGEIASVAGVSFEVTEPLQAKREIELQATALKEQAELLDLVYDAVMVRRFDGTIISWHDEHHGDLQDRAGRARERVVPPEQRH